MRHKHLALHMLQAANNIAAAGDHSLSTRQWVAMVTADAHAALGDERNCRMALERAEQVRDLPTSSGKAWLRFTADRFTADQVEPRLPYHPTRGSDKPDLIVVAPATFNTVNKVAAGISDNLALSILNEALVAGPPIVMVPCVKDSLRAHPTWTASVERLTGYGMRFVDLEGRKAANGLMRFDWSELMPQLPSAVDHAT